MKLIYVLEDFYGGSLNVYDWLIGAISEGYMPYSVMVGQLCSNNKAPIKRFHRNTSVGIEGRGNEQATY